MARLLDVVAALALCTSVAYAGGEGFEAEVGLGAGRWNAETTSITDGRFALGGHVGVGTDLMLHAGAVVDLLAVDTTTNNGLAELGVYSSLTMPLGQRWSFGPRVSFEFVEKPIAMVGVRVSRRPIAVEIDAVHMFASERPTGVIGSASLTGKAGAWGLAIGGVLALLFAAGSRGNG